MLRVYIALVLLSGTIAEFDPEKHENWKLLPHDVCGRRGSNRIIGGEVTPLSAFPWIVRVGTTIKASIHFSCAGVLINSDTVLTAAHCLPTIPASKLGPIRLGEYNVETNPDCEDGVCADPVMDVSPLRILAPEGYYEDLIHNDIALIKLKQNLTFTESVAPICIGNKKFYEQDFAGKMTEVAGWGYKNVESKKKSKKLEAVKLPVLKAEVCKERYREKFEVSEAQMCAGENGLDACNGDSGGPLMKVQALSGSPRYYLVGIVSFGPIHCGNSRFPGIYTNLTTFIQWVLDNLGSTPVHAVEVNK